MDTIFKQKDVIHNVEVWFERNSLPDAKKLYLGRSQILPHLSVEEVATKAELYGMNINAEEMVRYVNAYNNLCAYLVADGYGIENSLFRTRIRIPGEYDGYETSLPEGLHVTPRINASPGFQDYIREHVKLDFRGIDETQGHMLTYLDEASGKDTKITLGNLLHIHGSGIKVVHDDKPEHISAVGLWFVSVIDPTSRTRATALAVNEPKQVVAVIPASLIVGQSYYLEITTQSSAKRGAHTLQNMRTMRSKSNFECIAPAT
jgi:hypothetical protein